MAAEDGLTFRRLTTLAFIIFLVDLPWLSIITGPYNAAIKLIQGNIEPRMRPIAAFIVYPALAYLAFQTTSLRQAFYTGIAVYAVYEFTVMALFNKYPYWLGITDTLWGGILFTIIFYLKEKYNL